LLIAAFKGKLGDFFRTIKTKPGAVLIGAAVIGGPLASTCYVLGLQSAGSIIVPISALCPAIGAILSRFLYKQPLTPRMLLGIFICFAASAMIGSTGLADNAPPNLFIGLMFGFLAAFGWGLEGCVGGYATSMVDPEIGITIRQVTSGITNLMVLVPLFALIGGADAFGMVRTAFADSQAMPWFAVAGFGAYFAFMLWYKGNAMCGTALGMSCNGAFSFWGPFFCWLVLGLWFGIDGYALAPIAWLAAVVMVVGIFTIAVNPVDFFKRKG
jgi:drug/metabolite transporter (DMT)-like permease